jgi:DNA-binding transcriptional MocR family regulator
MKTIFQHLLHLFFIYNTIKVKYYVREKTTSRMVSTVKNKGGPMLNYDQFYSTSAKGMKKSEIREILKLISKPGLISFAGGLPAPDLFPLQEIVEAPGKRRNPLNHGTNIYRYLVSTGTGFAG